MILYFGDPQGAHALLDRGLRLVGVVHGRPGGVGRKGLPARLKSVPRWTLPDLKDPAVVQALAAAKPSLIVAAFYPRRIPRPVLDLAPGINVHPSDLPRWRGPDPCHWTIRSGDQQTAICVQYLAEEFDAGDVLTRHVVPVGPRESCGHLAARLETLGAQHIADVAQRLVAGEEIAAEPQAGEVTWAPLVDPDDLEIDWSQSAVEVDRLVRASAPDPGAYSGIGNELLVVFSGTPVAAKKFTDLPAGTPFVWRGQAHIVCGHGAFRLGRLQLGRKRITGRTLARLLV